MERTATATFVRDTVFDAYGVSTLQLHRANQPYTPPADWQDIDVRTFLRNEALLEYEKATSRERHQRPGDAEQTTAGRILWNNESYVIQHDLERDVVVLHKLPPSNAPFRKNELAGATAVIDFEPSLGTARIVARNTAHDETSTKTVNRIDARDRGYAVGLVTKEHEHEANSKIVLRDVKTHQDYPLPQTKAIKDLYGKSVVATYEAHKTKLENITRVYPIEATAVREISDQFERRQIQKNLDRGTPQWSRKTDERNAGQHGHHLGGLLINVADLDNVQAILETMRQEGYDAIVVTALTREGSIYVGKTEDIENNPELASQPRASVEKLYEISDGDLDNVIKQLENIQHVSTREEVLFKEQTNIRSLQHDYSQGRTRR